MKHILFTVFALILSISVISAQGTLVTCKKPMHNFGEIMENAGKVTHIFQIKNSGKSPFAIQKVDTSCGCTVTDWSKEPILPGKTGTVSVTFDPKGRPGKFVKSVSVYCTGMKRSYNLTIRGIVLTEIKSPEK